MENQIRANTSEMGVRMKALTCALMLLCMLVLGSCNVLREDREIGKLEWSPNRQYAFLTVAYLNDKHPGLKGDHICVIDVGGDSDVLRLEDAVESEYGLVEWSPDSKQLAFSSGPGLARDREIYVLDVKSHQVSRLSQLGGSSLFPAWSPDSQRVAFVWYNTVWDPEASIWEPGHGVAIYIVNADGSDLRELIRSESYFSNLAWLPDGKKLVFKSSVGLFLADADTGEIITLTDGLAGHEYFYALSPDGQHIALALEPDQDGDNGVYIINLDNQELRQVKNVVVSEAIENISPGHLRLYSRIYWAPDSSSFVFELNNYQQGQGATTFIAAADGNAIMQLVSPGSAADLSLFLWAPDSQRILVKDTHKSLYVMNTTDTESVLLRIPAQFRDLGNFQWSPDGRWILSEASLNREKSILVINSENGDVFPLIVLPDFTSVVWLSDGKHLAFFELSDDELPVGYIIDLEGNVLYKEPVDCK